MLLSDSTRPFSVLSLKLDCDPMLVTEPNVVWLLVTVLVVAILFVTTTLPSNCLLCQILPCPCCVWKIHSCGEWHNSAGCSSGGQVKWVARLSRNSKNWENSLFNNNKKIVFIETRLWDNKKQTTDVCFPGKQKKNIKRGRVTLWIFVKSEGYSVCLGSRIEEMLLWQSWVSSWSLFSSSLRICFLIPFLLTNIWTKNGFWLVVQ